MAKRGPPKLAPKPKPAAAAATTDKAPARGAEKKALEKEHQIEAAAEENKPIESFSARNIDDILDLMDTIHDSTAAAPSAGGGQVSKGGAAAMIDRHPERRAKAAYQAYLERETPIVREENPHLRLSQIKDIVWKNWLKSPENPRNMSRIAHNATQEEIDAVIEGERKNIQDRLRI
ncbi:hypothetical protein BX070DRAFT_229886 [Coemansia spiralis]|nr:hypothetical protein BX070DRAFT_229886 [Coemansia spiralis]